LQGSPPITRPLDEPVRKPRAKKSLPHQFGFCAPCAQKPGGNLDERIHSSRILTHVVVDAAPEGHVDIFALSFAVAWGIYYPVSTLLLISVEARTP
jgi:hypothetical protein